ncbi:MAG: hypothetical protein JO061_12235 [Acidobacteriaceae bacterium]|nr:hypothetical protein [Acidobacteriaceae bacterium]
MIRIFFPNTSKAMIGTVARHAADYAREHGVFTFTSVTVHEIVFGLEVKKAAAQLQKVMAWLNQNEQITPTATDYLDAANLRSVLGGRRWKITVMMPEAAQDTQQTGCGAGWYPAHRLPIGANGGLPTRRRLSTGPTAAQTHTQTFAPDELIGELA